MRRRETVWPSVECWGFAGGPPSGHSRLRETEGARRGGIAGDAPLVVAGEPEGGVAGSPLRGRPDVDARLAQALHGGQGDHGPGPLAPGGRATGAAETTLATGGQHGLLGAPLPGQGPDLAGGEATFSLGPFGGLGDAVALAQDVGLPLLEAHRARRHVFLVVGAFAEPGEGDSQAQGHVGAQTGGEPLVGKQAGGVVEVGVDEHHLHAQFLEPVAARGALEGGVDASARALRVGRPEDDHLRVLERVFQQIVLLGDAQAVAEAPHVHAGPVPAFPAVGVVLSVGEAHQVHEAVVGAGAVTHDTPEMVRPRGSEDGRRPLLALQPDYLLGDDVQGLVPADGLVAGMPRFWALRPPGPVEPGAPLGSKSTRLSGVRMRLGE